MALVGNDFYVANADAVVRFPYTPGADAHRRAGRQGDRPARRPATTTGPRTLIASRDGSKLYATVGSNSNVAENGMEIEEGRAAIWEIDPKTGDASASSPPACATPTAWRGSRAPALLWTVVNERDELGSDLVPDYLTSVRDGGFYGWPYSYFGQHVDERVKPPRPDLVAKAIKPDYALGSHVASLGLAYVRRRRAAGAVRERHVHRPARLVEPQAAQRLQGGLRAVQRRQAVGPAGRRADRLRDAARATPTAGRSAWRSTSAARCWWPTTSATSSGA